MSQPRIILLSLLGMALSLASIFLLDQKIAPMVLVPDGPARQVWLGISGLGNSAWMGILVLALWGGAQIIGKFRPQNPLWPAVRKKSALVFAAVAIPGITVMLIKVLIGRARPYMGDIGFFPFTTGSDYASWPSGHTTTAVSFAVAVGLAIPALRWPLTAIAAAVGFSRMTLGVHYFGDVIAGATLGSIGALLVYRWLAVKLEIKT